MEVAQSRLRQCISLRGAQAVDISLLSCSVLEWAKCHSSKALEELPENRLRGPNRGTAAGPYAAECPAMGRFCKCPSFAPVDTRRRPENLRSHPACNARFPPEEQLHHRHVRSLHG